MKRFLGQLTYANVVATLSLFLVLAGGTAFAAKQMLPKNSVGSKQLKKNAVTGSKIKNGTITGSKISLSSLGTVPSATTAGHASTADSATTAGTATNAVHAGTADNASATNGMHLGTINFVSGANAPATTVFSGDGLTLTASCTANAIEFTATTSVPNAEIYGSGNFLATFNGSYIQNFTPGETAEVGEWMGDNSQDEVQGQLVYSTLGGSVVTAQVSMNDFGHNGVGEGCALRGTTEAS
jgi:hypothetical protein